MRGLVLDLQSPHPMGEELPALYQEDPFAQRLTSALDDVLAPVFVALDNLPAYLDPELAPTDFLCWLAGWVGVGLDENWPEARQRELVARAADLYRRRGTVSALATQIALYTGATPEIEDSGGVASSTTPGGTMPGTGDPRLVVRVRVPDPDSVDLRRLEALVAEARPAHVPAQVEVSKP